MSNAQSAIVFAHSRAAMAARLVLLVIADHDGEGGAWPSVATIGRHANLSESTVKRAIKHLANLGELEVHVQQGGTRRTPAHRRPNRYEILLACPPTCDGTARHNDRAPVENLEPPVDNPSSTGGSPVNPHERDGGSPVNPLGGSPVNPEPSLEPPNTPPTPRTPPPLPESVARYWGGQGIAIEEQETLWATLLADTSTIVPARRAIQPAWLVPTLAALRAKSAKTRGAAIEAVRRYGDPCQHDTPGGAELHPVTGLPLCPLCRAGKVTP